MSDKRSAPRIAKPVEVSCRTIDAQPVPLRARISDLSSTGAFLDCIAPAPVGTMLSLHIELPGSPIDLTAEVVHEMPRFGMGVRFVEVPPEARGQLARYLLTHY